MHKTTFTYYLEVARMKYGRKLISQLEHGTDFLIVLLLLLCLRT